MRYDFRYEQDAHLFVPTESGEGGGGGGGHTHTHFGFRFTDNGGDSNYAGALEIELYETVGGPNLLASESFVLRGNSFFSGFPRENATDQDFGTRWLFQASAFGVGVDFIIEFDVPTTVRQYGISAYGAFAARDLTEWEVRVADSGTANTTEGSEYSTIDTQTGVTYDASHDTQAQRFVLP